jgi:hypothetical protein
MRSYHPLIVVACITFTTAALLSVVVSYCVFSQFSPYVAAAFSHIKADAPALGKSTLLTSRVA